MVLIWDDKDYEYKIFRSSKQDGDYEYIGVSDDGSYRDDTVTYPNTYYYKIEKNDLNNQKSEPFQAVVVPEEISDVSVIMYHNFVSDEDIKNGVEFEEYSISPDAFEEDLLWLKDNGYITITSDDLLRHLEGKKPFRKRRLLYQLTTARGACTKTHGRYLKNII